MERLLWIGPVGDPGGYGAVARNYLRGLVEIGAAPVVVPLRPPHPGLGPRDLELLAGLPTQPRGDETAVLHVDPRSMPALLPHARRMTAGSVVGCTIAETDRIPGDWAAACNTVDELWVPSEFNRLTFARSGVDHDRVRVVPYGLDIDAWTPEGPVSSAVGGDVFCFLYCFGFDWRKGFDVLLAAYLQEFSADEAVTLCLKVFDPPQQGPAQAPLRQRLADSLRPHGVALDAPGAPRVLILDQHIDQEELAALYRRADLYVSTERANGWGMPSMEVMAMDGATAAMDWGGSTEWMHPGNTLLIPPGPLVGVDERLISARPEFSRQFWPELPVDAVRRLLRESFEGQHDLAALGAAGGREVREDWNAARAAEALLARNSAEAYRSPEGLRERLRPLIGLAGESPFAEARETVFAAAYEPAASGWRAALDAHVEAFTESDPVTLCLLAEPGVDPDAMTEAVVEHLSARGTDPERIPDTLLTIADCGEALVEPRLRAVVEPATLWPLTTRRVPADPAALRAAAA